MALLIWIIGSILGVTWRVTLRDPHSLLPFDDYRAGRIYCFWHSQLLALTFIFRNTGKTAVVSKSKDGQIAAGVAKRWKHGIIFGSSSRGGSTALRQCVRLLKEKRCIVITPDGPRGPKETVKPGIAQIALMARSPVVAVRMEADRCWRLGSWDRFVIPKPFASVMVTLCEPIPPSAGAAPDATVESLRTAIEERLRDNDQVA